VRKKRYVILDRDGTIITDKNYLSDPAEIELLPGAARGLRRLQRLGLGLVIITNQSAVGRGILNLSRLDMINDRLFGMLEEEQIKLGGIYFCPHRPEVGCDCRKPGTGLMNLAAKDLDFDPGQSFVIGDKECDIVLGRRVGATTVLVLTGYGRMTRAEGNTQPDFVVNDLDRAAAIIGRLIKKRTRYKNAKASAILGRPGEAPPDPKRRDQASRR